MSIARCSWLKEITGVFRKLARGNTHLCAFPSTTAVWLFITINSRSPIVFKLGCYYTTAEEERCREGGTGMVVFLIIAFYFVRVLFKNEVSKRFSRTANKTGRSRNQKQTSQDSHIRMKECLKTTTRIDQWLSWPDLLVQTRGSSPHSKLFVPFLFSVWYLEGPVNLCLPADLSDGIGLYCNKSSEM